MNKLITCIVVVFLAALSPLAAQTYYVSESDRRAEKLELLLDELENGTYDADIHAVERAYQKLRKIDKQCSNYQKAIQRLNNNISSEQRKRYYEASRQFSEAAKNFRTELAPLMTRMKVSENTWLYTWGISNFCVYGTDGQYADSLFKTEKKTLKEALQDCIFAHLNKVKTTQKKSAAERDFL